MPKLIKTKIEVEGRVTEEYAWVEKPKTVAWDAEDELDVVGKPIPRIDGEQRVSGSARYPSDIHLPGMLYARIVRSPHAHARVKRVNTERAKKLPGVRAILTSENAPATPWRMSASRCAHCWPASSNRSVSIGIER